MLGISFGSFLIKHVVDELKAELPRLKTFATLSPIPGFRAWVRRELDEERLHLRATERKAVGEEVLAEPIRSGDLPADEQLLEGVKLPLMGLCARYLLHAKRVDGGALDPVANFHLSNGTHEGYRDARAISASAEVTRLAQARNL